VCETLGHPVSPTISLHITHCVYLIKVTVLLIKTVKTDNFTKQNNELSTITPYQSSVTSTYSAQMDHPELMFFQETPSLDTSIGFVDAMGGSMLVVLLSKFLELCSQDQPGNDMLEKGIQDHVVKEPGIV